MEEDEQQSLMEQATAEQVCTDGDQAYPQNQRPDTPPPQAPKRKSRHGCCIAALVLFILLCMVAAVGTWYMRRSGIRPDPPTISLPPSFPLPIPRPMPPGPTPHALPDDLEGVLQVLTPVMRERFEDVCRENDIEWPPDRVRLVGLKAEAQLEMWAANRTGDFKLLKTYPVLAASGDLGPKRLQGDYQVPEGHYRMVYLNPKSKFHLSLLLDYPNATDKAREAKSLKRGKDLGGDICVHGSKVSVGYLAIGDAAIEEVFTMAALADSAHRDILIFPADFRKRPDLISLAGNDSDVLKLYEELARLAETVKTD